MALRETGVRGRRAPMPGDVDDPRYYPESDGKPMGETERHVLQLARLLECVRLFFADDPNVHVGGNSLIYYVRGDRRRFVVPDLFVVRGVSKEERRFYLTCVEGKAPDFILELLSWKTERRDRTTKKRLYQNTFRTQEYFLFDPDTRMLDGYRLDSTGRYRALPGDSRGRLFSEVLGLTWGVDRGGWLRVYRPDGTVVPTLEEAAANLQQATATIAAQAAEIERLNAELARLRGPE
jgi:Uma2 family endonuclease